MTLFNPVFNARRL